MHLVLRAISGTVFPTVFQARSLRELLGRLTEEAKEKAQESRLLELRAKKDVRKEAMRVQEAGNRAELRGRSKRASSAEELGEAADETCTAGGRADVENLGTSGDVNGGGGDDVNGGSGDGGGDDVNGGGGDGHGDGSNGHGGGSECLGSIDRSNEVSGEKDENGVDALEGQYGDGGHACEGDVKASTHAPEGMKLPPQDAPVHVAADESSTLTSAEAEAVPSIPAGRQSSSVDNAAQLTYYQANINAAAEPPLWSRTNGTSNAPAVAISEPAAQLVVPEAAQPSDPDVADSALGEEANGVNDELDEAYEDDDFE